MTSIPKVLHFVWIGDESKRPDNCIDTWRRTNPGFEVVVWGNAEYESHPWRSRHHMDAIMRTGQLSGVADLMRWEILWQYGGFALDCDSIAVAPLPEWMFECTAFCCWENELARPGLIANGYFAARAANPLIGFLMDSLVARKNLAYRFVWYKLKYRKQLSWKTTGPQAITDAYRRLQYRELTILPSHFFCPRHPSGLDFTGSGPVYCDQLFGTASGKYDYLHTLSIEEMTIWKQKKDQRTDCRTA